MPITTTDVCTNVVSGVEVTNNGTTIVSCLSTGEYESINATLDTSIGYTTLEAKLTNRFDDVTYYTIGTNTLVGG
jgi:hypothetical protein